MRSQYEVRAQSSLSRSTYPLVRYDDRPSKHLHEGSSEASRRSCWPAVSRIAVIIVCEQTHGIALPIATASALEFARVLRSASFIY